MVDDNAFGELFQRDRACDETAATEAVRCYERALFHQIPIRLPLTDDSLTIITAYLVETPINQKVATVTLAMNPDIGLRIFVIGHNEAACAT